MDKQQKYFELKNKLKEYNSVAVAYSSGVDSTFLLKVAKDVLDKNVIAITASSDFFCKRETNEAINFCRKNNIKHILFEINELKNEIFAKNPKNRCYFCKKDLFEKIISIAKDNKIENIIEGSNFDDIKDYRPGMLAIDELKVKSPLKEVGLTKKEIRELSKELNLKTAHKSSFACLASRFEYGIPITKEKLKMVEKAEDFLFELGFEQFRVRIHDKMARIEVEQQNFLKIIENRKAIVDYFKKIGFSYVSMDIEGYRIGSMNETIIKE